MRVALVAEDYYPQLGGVPEHVHHLAHELIRRGHTVGVITSRISSRGHRHSDDPFVRRIGKSLVIYANGGPPRAAFLRPPHKRLGEPPRPRRHRPGRVTR